jgi:hypothetical protein
MQVDGFLWFACTVQKLLVTIITESNLGCSTGHTDTPKCQHNIRHFISFCQIVIVTATHFSNGRLVKTN